MIAAASCTNLSTEPFGTERGMYFKLERMMNHKMKNLGKL